MYRLGHELRDATAPQVQSSTMIPPDKLDETGGERGLLLASASPRRRELLALLGFPFTILATDAEETDNSAPDAVLKVLPPSPLPVTQHPALLAWRKVRAAWGKTPADVVLGADTIVVLDGEVLNKPRDAAHARTMLQHLSGRVHQVYTGLCIRSCYSVLLGTSGQSDNQRKPSGMHDTEGFTWFDLVVSDVTFAPLQPADIDRYVATGEPLDKAGAYAVQGLGGSLVQQVAGSFTAVVGLPLVQTWHLLAVAGITPKVDPSVAYHNWLHTQGKEPLPCPPTLP